MFFSGATADDEVAADAEQEKGVADGFGGCFPLIPDLDLILVSANKSAMFGVLLRPLLGLTLVSGVAMITSSSAFFGCFPTDLDLGSRFGGGGGVGGTLGIDFARTGGGGVGTSGRLGPAACVDGDRFVVNVVASVAVSIFGVGSAVLDLGTDLALGTVASLSPYSS